MDAYEIPLVLFTVLSQWAVGIVIGITLLEWFKPKFMESVGGHTGAYLPERGRFNSADA